MGVLDTRSTQHSPVLASEDIWKVTHWQDLSVFQLNILLMMLKGPAVGCCLWYHNQIRALAWVTVDPLSSQLTANSLRQSADDGCSWAPGLTRGTRKKFLAPGLSFGQSWPLWLLGEWTSIWKISLISSKINLFKNS